jgi:uncharacterized protein
VPWDGKAPDKLPRTMFLQERIEGMACGAVYVAARGRAALLGVTRQLIGQSWAGARGFVYWGSLGPLSLSADIRNEFEAIGDALAGHFDLVGLFGVDAILNSSGVWPIEINPRYTASVELLERASQKSAVAQHVHACDEGILPPDLPMEPARCYGKAIAFASRTTTISSDISHCLPSDESGWPSLADIPAPPATIDAGWPVASVFAEAADEKGVLDGLKHRVALVRSAVGA